MTDTTEAAWLTHRGFEKLSREIVASYARDVRKILRPRLIGSRRFFLTGKMTISTYDFYVFLLVVRKTTAPGSVLRLLN